jgi:hypothetical protein
MICSVEAIIHPSAPDSASNFIGMKLRKPWGDITSISQSECGHRSQALKDKGELS